MLEVLRNFGLDPTLVISGAAASALLFFLLYRKFLVGALEPLSLFVIAQIGDASIMWAMPVALSYKWQLLVYMLFLWAGFAVKGKAKSGGPPILLDRNSFIDLTLVLTVLCVVIVCANLYLGATAGFPLLSKNPTAAKFTIYTGGLGIVRRINTGPYYFLCAGCSLMVVTRYKRRVALTLAFLATSLVMLSGNKSALLPLVLTFSLASLHKGLSPQTRLRKSIQKCLLVLLLSGVVIALIITTKEQGSLVAGVQGLVLRLLLAGDGIIFYYPRRELIMTLVDPSIMGYLHSVLNDVQGLLRVGSYEAVALGTLIMGGEEGGPNVQYFLHADLFFGPVLGSIYSFVIGYLIAIMRNNFFSSTTKSALRFSIRLFLAAAAFDLATEAGLFTTELVVMLLFVVPLYLLARFVRVCLVRPDAWATSLIAQPHLTAKVE